MEKWKRHPKYTAYEVSSLGKVRRAEPGCGTWMGRILKQTMSSRGYPSVVLRQEKIQSMVPIHVLMLEAFIGPRPFTGAEARHINDRKVDLRLDNLTWGTRAENYADRVVNGGGNHGERCGAAKLKEVDVLLMRAYYDARVVSLRDIGRVFGVSVSTASRTVNYQRWTYL